MIDFLLHIDKHIGELIRNYGPQAYAILFAIVFAETGFVVTPFLPGDSLIFAVGIFCHPSNAHHLNFWLTFAVLMVAALGGDNLNYFLGRNLGPRLFKNDKSRFLKRGNLDKTHAFFEKHGKKTVILARFVPIVRTFCPFVAGMGAMAYREFLLYSVIGALLWVGIFLTAGYAVATIPLVQKNFTYAVVAMVVVTGAPLLYEVWRSHKKGEI